MSTSPTTKDLLMEIISMKNENKEAILKSEEAIAAISSHLTYLESKNNRRHRSVLSVHQSYRPVVRPKVETQEDDTEVKLKQRINQQGRSPSLGGGQPPHHPSVPSQWEGSNPGFGSIQMDDLQGEFHAIQDSRQCLPNDLRLNVSKSGIKGQSKETASALLMSALYIKTIIKLTLAIQERLHLMIL